MTEAGNKYKPWNATKSGRLFWASCELERSAIRIDAMSTSLDALLAMMKEHTPTDATLENLRIWLSELFATEYGILKAINEEVSDVGREIDNQDPDPAYSI